jgi:hypothetical protein
MGEKLSTIIVLAFFLFIGWIVGIIFFEGSICLGTISVCGVILAWLWLSTQFEKQKETKPIDMTGRCKRCTSPSIRYYQRSRGWLVVCLECDTEYWDGPPPDDSYIED